MAGALAIGMTTKPAAPTYEELAARFGLEFESYLAQIAITDSIVAELIAEEQATAAAEVEFAESESLLTLLNAAF